MSHAVLDVTVVVRVKAYPHSDEDSDDYKPWEDVKDETVNDLLYKRVVDGKPTFWEWFTGWYEYEPEVIKVISAKLVEEIFDGE